MSFWSNLADRLGLRPIDSVGDFFADAGAFLSGGLYQADENRFGWENLISPYFLGAASDTLNDSIKNQFSSALDVSDVSNVLGEQDFGDYLADLLQTDEEAALRQWQRNEESAEAAYRRSEEAADRALARARELRQTAALDAVQSLKAAGLNPVLAAGNLGGGSAVTAPQASAPSASSQKAEGLNLATILQAIASMLSGTGNLLGSFLPKKSMSISEVTHFTGR